MSPSSATSHASGKPSTQKCRGLSASQISKDACAFEEWSIYQNLEQASFTADLPPSIKHHAGAVFNLDGHLPQAWLAENKKVSRNLARMVTPGFMSFLASAKASTPALFASKVSHDDERKEILQGLQMVFTAWQNARKMRDSSRKWQEADYAARVYALVRQAAIQCSEPREQCTIALPQPVLRAKVPTDVARILSGKTAKPDGCLFIPTRLLVAELCERDKSPFNVLHRHSRSVQKTGTACGDASFRYQSTLCAKLPDAHVFEVVSTCWEDKKPSQDELIVAYRQNRMATAAALRQLHALNVRTPVFGLVWAEGCVRAHADWWEERSEDGKKVVTIYSAAYGADPSQAAERRRSLAFHQWDLAEPADIIQVYLFIRNLDRWTTGAFRDAVVEGVTDLAQRVSAGQADMVAWRRKGDLSVPATQKAAAAAPSPEPAWQSAEPPAAAKRKSKKRKTPRTSVGSGQ
ncbi:hypothetical protein C8Q77DRAFT_88345 [Trametes polyzona]|nr:hypothetical protein C8Q77DRAFT_88345 [Trametes polyzona]